ncbi:MAG: DJ-1/PfpI family protein [Pseudomonadota bacterium]
MIDRRQAALLLAGGLTACSTSPKARAAAPAHSHDDHKVRSEDVHNMDDMPDSWNGNEVIAMVMYPGMTALDLVGPQYMFASMMGAKVHLVAETLDPVMSDTSMAIMPTTDFANAPKDVTFLCVPGGITGTLNAMKNDAVMDFVADRGERADYVTSVCTGSMILGAAGLLDGYRATSHWVSLDALPAFGAIPVAERIVEDRNRITAAGVSAGLDFGLEIVGRQRGQEYAEVVQLLAEYAPEPPYAAGHYPTAPKAAKDSLNTMFEGLTDRFASIGTVR